MHVARHFRSLRARHNTASKPCRSHGIQRNSTKLPHSKAKNDGVPIGPQTSSKGITCWTRIQCSRDWPGNLPGSCVGTVTALRRQAHSLVKIKPRRGQTQRAEPHHAERETTPPHRPALHHRQRGGGLPFGRWSSRLPQHLQLQGTRRALWSRIVHFPDKIGERMARTDRSPSFGVRVDLVHGAQGTRSQAFQGTVATRTTKTLGVQKVRLENANAEPGVREQALEETSL